MSEEKIQVKKEKKKKAYLQKMAVRLLTYIGSAVWSQGSRWVPGVGVGVACGGLDRDVLSGQT